MKNKVIFICSIIILYVAGKIFSQKKLERRILTLTERCDKNAHIIRTFNEWMKEKQSNHSLNDFFRQQNIQEIAIYGMHYLGERLLDELRETQVVVRYAIDERADSINSEIKLVKPDGKLEKVDAIIVTAVFYFNDIERALSTKINCPIISLDEILDNM